MIKPVIHYSTREDVTLIRRPNGAFVARVYTFDHPRLGSALIGTSRVLRFDPESGEFETMNSHYKPAPDGR